MRWYAVASWALLLVGIVPAVWFGISWGRRVKRPWSLAAFDAGGWVYALIVLYVHQAIVYAVFGVPEPPNTWLAISRVLLGLLIDALIIARALRWRSLQADFNTRQDPRSHELPPTLDQDTPGRPGPR